MNLIVNINTSILKIAHGMARLFSLVIFLAISPSLQAATADELYARGFHEFQSNNYIAALEFLSAYKYHPDSRNADAAKMKSVDDAIQFSETNLTNCKSSTGNHTVFGGGSFQGKAVLSPATQ